jgi:menaquinone-dependent protoporphyrinogen IX oxidase
MVEKTLIVYATKTGINREAANIIADTLRTTYNMDVTLSDLKISPLDPMPFQNVIVGSGVEGTTVYSEPVDFLEKDFGGKKVAIFFCCEDYENPRMQSTEDNLKKVLVLNTSLKPIDVAAFGGCMRKQGMSMMDDLNRDRVREWAIELGKKFNPSKKEYDSYRKTWFEIDPMTGQRKIPWTLAM